MQVPITNPHSLTSLDMILPDPVVHPTGEMMWWEKFTHDHAVGLLLVMKWWSHWARDGHTSPLKEKIIKQRLQHPAWLYPPTTKLKSMVLTSNGWPPFCFWGRNFQILPCDSYIVRSWEVIVCRTVGVLCRCIWICISCYYEPPQYSKDGTIKWLL